MASSASQKRPKSLGALGDAAGLAPGWPVGAGVATLPVVPALAARPRPPLEPTATPMTKTTTSRTNAAIERAGRGAGGVVQLLDSTAFVRSGVETASSIGDS